MITRIRCKKCRNILLENKESDQQLLNAHGASLNETGTPCSSVTEQTMCFLNDEVLPDWANEKIVENEWIRGRLHCPKCQARMGAFDFVSRQKCECGQTFLPAVHIIKSKVDILRN
ncbi:hypothetical protein HUJ04_003419 [Dendroctonus ponderosae]|nr:hypothetical protein HUJ04_003419 [Dendroctonus ponderosae]KAH1010053.1 hypothetical protein HUJ05_004413 [Dendroctonus ponderosae]